MNAYTGLTDEQVRQKHENGENNIKNAKMRKTFKEIVFSNTFTFFNALNFVLFMIILVAGHARNTLFFITVLSNLCIGIYQEVKAVRELRGIEMAAEEKIQVRRNGTWVKCSADDLVKDDLIMIMRGMRIPADAVILEGMLEVNESVLNGESDAASKKEGSTVYYGTDVLSGRADARVTAVGRNRMAAVILDDANDPARAESTLQNDLDRLIRIVSKLIIPIGLILFALSLIAHSIWQDAVISAAGAMIGMIPSGLVILTSAALYVSAVRLSKKKVLVQDLFAIESLARTDCLCIDKTGTITTGRMLVTDLICDEDQQSVMELMKAFVKNERSANATGKALEAYFGSDTDITVSGYVPFTSERKHSSFVYEGNRYCLGADAVLLKNTDFSEYTKEGRRVLVLIRETEDEPQILAKIILQDELRTNIKSMMEYLQSQDVIIKVISGDDPSAVSHIAQTAGVRDAEKYTDLSKRTESFDVLAEKYAVFGRVMPKDKKELVEALQRKGYHCAMTGDGVNDVPAIKRADIGISMGDASMAARDSSSLIILDNDFSGMPDIINEGRRVINNITHAASMFLVKTLFSFILSVFVILTMKEYPIVPVQLTAVSTCMVGIPAFLLQFEPDFRKNRESFLFSAFFNSLPSAVTAVLICINASLMTGTVLDEPHAAAVRVILLGFIYFLTLLRTYYPWSTYRLGIILSMGVLFALIILFVPSLIYIELSASAIRYLLIGAAAAPVLIFVFSKLFMLIYTKYRKYRYGS